MAMLSCQNSQKLFKKRKNLASLFVCALDLPCTGTGQQAPLVDRIPRTRLTTLDPLHISVSVSRRVFNLVSLNRLSLSWFNARVHTLTSV